MQGRCIVIRISPYKYILRAVSVILEHVADFNVQMNEYARFLVIFKCKITQDKN